MRILILGCGFLGQRVARRLVPAGHVVLATTRTPQGAAQLANIPGLTPLVADLLDASSLRALPAVYATLVCVGFDRHATASRRQVQVEGLSRFLDVGGLHSSPLVYTSSTSVYGQNQGEWVDEDAPTAPHSESGRILIEAENVLLDAAETHTPLTILRLAGLYGPGRLIRRQTLLQGDPIPADPDQILNLIHVDDAARAAIAALSRPAARGPSLLLNVCDDAPAPRRVHYETAAQLLGAPSPRFATPDSTRNEDSNRRVSNRRLKATLLPSLLYPDARSGLSASLAEEQGSPLSFK